MSFLQELINKSFSIELLVCLEGIKFLTSNSPAFHISTPEMKLDSIEKFEGFMPLSPNVAMIIRGHKPKPIDKNFILRHVSSQEVEYWNAQIVQKADDEVYSVNKADDFMDSHNKGLNPTN